MHAYLHMYGTFVWKCVHADFASMRSAVNYIYGRVNGWTNKRAAKELLGSKSQKYISTVANGHICAHFHTYTKRISVQRTLAPYIFRQYRNFSFIQSHSSPLVQTLVILYLVFFSTFFWLHVFCCSFVFKPIFFLSFLSLSHDDITFHIIFFPFSQTILWLHLMVTAIIIQKHKKNSCNLSNERQRLKTQDWRLRIEQQLLENIPM